MWKETVAFACPSEILKRRALGGCCQAVMTKLPWLTARSLIEGFEE
jgi:hypothetical protein